MDKRRGSPRSKSNYRRKSVRRKPPLRNPGPRPQRPRYPNQPPAAAADRRVERPPPPPPSLLASLLSPFNPFSFRVKVFYVLYLSNSHGQFYILSEVDCLRISLNPLYRDDDDAVKFNDGAYPSPFRWNLSLWLMTWCLTDRCPEMVLNAFQMTFFTFPPGHCSHKETIFYTGVLWGERSRSGISSA